MTAINHSLFLDRQRRLLIYYGHVGACMSTKQGEIYIYSVGGCESILLVTVPGNACNTARIDVLATTPGRSRVRDKLCVSGIYIRWI